MADVGRFPHAKAMLRFLASAYRGKLVGFRSNLLTGKSTKPITPLLREVMRNGSENPIRKER